MKTIERIWTSFLNIGATPGMAGLQLLGLHVTNGFIFLGMAAIIVYVAIFTVIGTSNSLTGIIIIPNLCCVLLLNHIKQHAVARFVVIYITLLIVFFIALSDRRTGTEHLLLVMGLTSLVVFERYASMIAGLITACLLYFLYLHLDKRLVFEADPNKPYSLINEAILFLCGVWTISLLFIFRHTTFRFARKLSHALSETAATNSKLNELTNELNQLIASKSIDLQTQQHAIDAHMMSMTTDKMGNIIAMNQNCLDVLEYSRGDMLGRNFRTLDPDYDHDTVEEMQRVLASGDVFRQEIRTKTKNGNVIWIDLLGIPVKATDSREECLLFLSVPISERKALEVIHNRALKGLETIAYRTSHKVRGPLARIIGLSLLLEKGLVPQDELPDFSAKMITSANELDAATCELTDYIISHERELGQLTSQ